MGDLESELSVFSRLIEVLGYKDMRKENNVGDIEKKPNLTSRTIF